MMVGAATPMRRRPKVKRTTYRVPDDTSLPARGTGASGVEQCGGAGMTSKLLGVETVDGQPLPGQPMPGTTASAHSFHPDRPTVYRVVALDATGNASLPSKPVVVSVTRPP